MCIDDCRMGGLCSFEDKRLIVAVENFHSSIKKKDHTYRLDLINEDGVVCSQEIDCSQPTYCSFDIKNCKFYRVEIFDTTDDLRIAVGNPIWNADQFNS